ncbi:MAG: hypothetical protein KDA25_02505, partial [Phycisphaerales bacterium]|nr:hypothetical protein [Phycisphaerales bacterium]
KRPLFEAGLNVPSLKLDVALATVEGVDSHDWIPDLAAALGLAEVQVLKASVSCWLSDATNQAAAQDLVNQIGALMAGASVAHTSGS